MSNDDILSYIQYLTIGINESLKKYQNTEDFNDLEYLKNEINYIYNIYKKELSLAKIDNIRFTTFLDKLDSLFDKYLIEEFDYYGNILRARYDRDVHIEYVKDLREKNRKRREKANG